MKTRRKGRTPIAVGKFGAWLLANMAIRDMTYDDLAKAAHIAYKNTICDYVRRRHRPSFQTIVTLCWAFDITDKDAVEIIWRLVKEDWA